MPLTIFDTPVVKHLLRGISFLYLIVFGWRKEGQLPDLPKYVIVVAPHTSNWDFPLGVAIACAYRLSACWMGKNALFRQPFGTFFKWFGGIPVDRSKPQGVVAQIVQCFDDNPQFVIALTPEGTRGGTKSWKSGFYHVARGANVPVVLAFMDYRRKVAGFGPTIHLTGDVNADMQHIRDFYADIVPKYPEKKGAISLSAES